MNFITQQALLGAAGQAGGSDPVYVEDLFQVYTYPGSDSAQTITNGLDLATKGGLVWIKELIRGGLINGVPQGRNHILQDTERGTGVYLSTNSQGQNVSSSNHLTAFNSDGFTVAGNNTDVNNNGDRYVSWSFRRAAGFFEICEYTGDGDPARTVSHALGSTPGMIIIKKQDNEDGFWYIWHRSLGGTGRALRLDDDDNVDINSNLFPTLPTSAVFSPGDNTHTNQQGRNYIAYIFAHDDARFGTNSNESIIKCGEITTSGSPVAVNLGFEPQWILLKSYGGSVGFGGSILDHIRGLGRADVNSTGARNRVLTPSSAEGDLNQNAIYPIPDVTGFTFNGYGTTSGTASQNMKYVYVAIRRPHKPAEDGTDVLKQIFHTGTGVEQDFDVGFNYDFFLSQRLNSTFSPSAVYDRPRGNTVFIETYRTQAQEGGGIRHLGQDWLRALNDFETNIGSGATYLWTFLRRTPKVFDIITFDHSGSSVVTVPHSLGAVPQLMLAKKYNASGAWYVYSSDLGNTKHLLLETAQGQLAYSNIPWDDTDPTTTHATFELPGSDDPKLCVAYLFASFTGISSIGTYSGSASDVDVNCSFTAGARFILIKKINAGSSIFASVGEWYSFSSVRGINSTGNDPYRHWSTRDPEVTDEDLVAPLNTGFTVKSVSNGGSSELNEAGGEYLYLAIA